MGGLLGIVRMPAGEIDQRVHRLLWYRSATGSKPAQQEVGEFLPRQWPQRVGSSHLQQRRASIMHRLLQQGLAGTEEGVADVLLVLNHGAQLAEQTGSQLHQVPEFVEAHAQ